MKYTEHPFGIGRSLLQEHLHLAEVDAREGGGSSPM